MELKSESLQISAELPNQRASKGKEQQTSPAGIRRAFHRADFPFLAELTTSTFTRVSLSLFIIQLEVQVEAGAIVIAASSSYCHC